MRVYIEPEHFGWYAIYSAASGDFKVRLPSEDDAIRYARSQGWNVINRPIPMDGTDYDVFGEE
jgi:hypothetical protein